jgi:signal transduction histidine kinase
VGRCPLGGGDLVTVVCRRVVAASTLHLAVAAGYLLAGRTQAPDLRWVLVVGAAVAVVGVLPCHIELRRATYDFTLAEAVLVAAALHGRAVDVVLGFALGEAVACRLYPLPWTKTLFNAAQQASASALGMGAFLLAAGQVREPDSPRVWVAALAGAGAAIVVSNVSTAWIMAGAERGALAGVLGSAAPTAAVTAVAAASLGLVVRLLLDARPEAVVLLVPVVVLVVNGARHMARARADALRFRRLYEASARSAGLGALNTVLAGLAGEAAQLATGAGAVCCTIDTTGTWWGVRADGSRLDGGTAAWLGEQDVTASLSPTDLPTGVASALHAEGSVLVVSLGGEAGAPVVLVVVREHTQHQDADVALEVLSAFAGTCSLVLANARLFDEVQEALKLQIDLNRQKAEFVAAVSHELRTPLAVVLGSLQTVRRLGEKLPVEAQAEMLATAEGGGNRLQRLIEDLLLVASNEHGSLRCTPDVVDLPALLAGVTSEATATGGPTCDLRIDEDLPVLVTDSDKLRRIIGNLVENAGKYAPGSIVEVEVRVGDDDLAVVVADHGDGIALEDRERVFEPFVQLDGTSTRRQGGTGLGLHLCRTMADLLGATIHLGDRADGGPGAEFTVRIPVVRSVDGTAEGELDVCSR